MDRSRDLSVYPGQVNVYVSLNLDRQVQAGPSLFTLASTVSVWVLILMARSRDLSAYPGQDCVYVGLILDGQVQRPLCLPWPGQCLCGSYS